MNVKATLQMTTQLCGQKKNKQSICLACMKCWVQSPVLEGKKGNWAKDTAMDNVPEEDDRQQISTVNIICL
jgi:hypothetical protein